MIIRFLGATACIPDKNDDCPSYVINGRYCFDCGWALVTNLINNDCNPSDIKYIIFTHMHHDHYLSLPTILFYYLQTGADLNSLTILGPCGEVDKVVKSALAFLQTDRYFLGRGYPSVVGIKSGDVFETEDMTLEACDALHTVTALCYKIKEKATGKVFGTTGDTTYKRDLGAFFHGCDAIAHETTLCVCKKELESEILCRHSSIYDAVNTANEAGVKKLFIMHGKRKYETDTIIEGKKYFDGEIIWPEIGREYFI